MFDKKQKSCAKRIHLVTDDDLCDQKAFYTVKIIFYSSSLENSLLKHNWRLSFYHQIMVVKNFWKCIHVNMNIKSKVYISIQKYT